MMARQNQISPHLWQLLVYCHTPGLNHVKSQIILTHSATLSSGELNLLVDVSLDLNKRLLAVVFDFSITSPQPESGVPSFCTSIFEGIVVGANASYASDGILDSMEFLKERGFHIWGLETYLGAESKAGNGVTSDCESFKVYFSMMDTVDNEEESNLASQLCLPSLPHALKISLSFLPPMQGNFRSKSTKSVVKIIKILYTGMLCLILDIKQNGDISLLLSPMYQRLSFG